MYGRFRNFSVGWDEAGLALAHPALGDPAPALAPGERVVAGCVDFPRCPACSRCHPVASSAVPVGCVDGSDPRRVAHHRRRGPVDVLDLLPFICVVLLTVYGTARYGTWGSSTGILLLAHVVAAAMLPVVGGAGGSIDGANAVIALVLMQ